MQDSYCTGQLNQSIVHAVLVVVVDMASEQEENTVQPLTDFVEGMG